MATAIHEQYNRSSAVKVSSDRTIGLVIGAALLVLGFGPLIRRHPMRVWAIVAGAAICLCALVLPGVLTPFTRIWTRFGLMMGKVTTPLILGVMFYGVLSAVGGLLRLFGVDLLRLKSEEPGDSFWIPRVPAGPPPESMKRMF